MNTDTQIVRNVQTIHFTPTGRPAGELAINCSPRELIAGSPVGRPAKAKSFWGEFGATHPTPPHSPQSENGDVDIFAILATFAKTFLIANIGRRGIILHRVARCNSPVQERSICH